MMLDKCRNNRNRFNPNTRQTYSCCSVTGPDIRDISRRPMGHGLSRRGRGTRMFSIDNRFNGILACRTSYELGGK